MSVNSSFYLLPFAIPAMRKTGNGRIIANHQIRTKEAVIQARNRFAHQCVDHAGDLRCV